MSTRGGYSCRKESIAIIFVAYIIESRKGLYFGKITFKGGLHARVILYAGHHQFIINIRGEVLNKYFRHSEQNSRNSVQIGHIGQ